jgi:2-polyprenyl-6-methoxyphenol hydroxylase-like FAD-dependent oxidoreductase
VIHITMDGRCRTRERTGRRRTRAGNNTGIQDGYALGRAIASGQLDEVRRHPVAQRVVAFTHRMTRVTTTRHPVTRGVGHTVLPMIGHRAMPKSSPPKLAELNYR